MSTLNPATNELTPADVRRTHLNHEASIQSIGYLYYLSAAACAISALVLPFTEDTSTTSRALLAGLMVVLALVYATVGRRLRRLDPRGRTPSILLSCIGLLGFPVGTLISAYILYLLLSKKGQMVFSDSYHEVIAATPEIKYKTSPLVWIFLGLLVLALVAIVAGALLSHV